MNHHIRLLIYTIFLLPAAVFAKAETKNIVYMDMRPLLNEDHHDSISVLDVWDRLHTVSTLQGIVNRRKPQFYINYVVNGNINADSYWWNKYRAAGPAMQDYAPDAYSSFSNNGIVAQKTPVNLLHNNMPVLGSDYDLTDEDGNKAAQVLVERVHARKNTVPLVSVHIEKPTLVRAINKRVKASRPWHNAAQRTRVFRTLPYVAERKTGKTIKKKTAR